MPPEPTRDLPGVSRQVLYEFEMVEALAKRQVDLIWGRPQPAWRERFQTPDPLERAPFESNAMLESLLLHTRALTVFLFASPPSEAKRAARRRRAKAGGLEDAFAEDYFADAISEWRKHPEGRGRRPSKLSQDSLNRISREIQHVTYHRAAFVEGGSSWNPYALYTALSAVIDRFARRVDPMTVCVGFRDRIAAALPVLQPPVPIMVESPLATYSVATQGLGSI